MDAAYSLNWNVDTSVGKTLTIASSILRVCTSDNIQPLSLLACESYGAKLAMCDETRLKMERLAQRRHSTALLKHLRISAGFMKGDAADHLAATDAGSESPQRESVLD